MPSICSARGWTSGSTNRPLSCGRSAPPSPHHGQGANQSIEDAIVLSDLLSSTTDWDHARAEHERRRRFRTRKIVDASVTVGEMLHLPDGARARERNTRLASPDAFDRDLDWIHSFRADEQVPEAPAVGG